ncbi:hypothetical protein BC332_24917 [Capsicum chinense]|nr:hypothetical protein BC332_24917 [Capsicum chinense]
MTTTPQDLDDPDRNKVENNGSSVINHNTPILDEAKGKGIETADPVGSSPSVKSSPTAKGFGLKKWRRIRREAHKDGDINTDSARLLKRGLSISAANSAKPPVHLSAGTVRNSDGSVASVNALLRSPDVLVDGFGVIGDSGLAIQALFFGGTDSDNSEDRSSRSSTAASAPKARYEAPVVHGYVPVKYGQRTMSGKMGTSAQQSHRDKGQSETSKKPRGQRVKIEKENSHSSMESDSQCSNFPSMQSNYHATSNGTQGGSSVNNDGQFSDEALAREGPFSEEIQTALDRRNGKECETQEDLGAESTWEVKEERSEYQGLSTDHDPLLESIITLQAAQENLEREIQKWKEIRIEDDVIDHALQDVCIPSDLSSGDADFAGPNKSEQPQSRNGVQRSFNSLESEVVSLKQNVILLQNKLNDETELIKLKEARVAELETAILTSNSKKEEKKTGNGLHQSTEDIERKLEGLFRQKIEAEVEYLTISRTIQKLRAAAVDEVALLEKQKISVSEQAQMVKNLGDSEMKVSMLKSQAAKMEKNYCDDAANTSKNLELHKSVCKYSSYFLIQLVLLAIVFGLYMSQMSPDAVEVVPT